ncbi:uncharacterized protein CLUP02_08927 [Colletotrichum lupini]|uniref:Uncharacterized protein n=1 Tax=Colletotrichum lupini TaxID=145971 RepID=A0A9Q8SVL8_9PEZI|nr:uncharacterized protein CLUP02_08927 [Colletotrichum lupini]UQC83432.1 hypothetical protein CLUP02_08927 [Colletotrichum lupini]
MGPHSAPVALQAWKLGSLHLPSPCPAMHVSTATAPSSLDVLAQTWNPAASGVSPYASWLQEKQQRLPPQPADNSRACQDSRSLLEACPATHFDDPRCHGPQTVQSRANNGPESPTRFPKPGRVFALPVSATHPVFHFLDRFLVFLWSLLIQFVSDPPSPRSTPSPLVLSDTRSPIQSYAEASPPDHAITPHGCSSISSQRVGQFRRSYNTDAAARNTKTAPGTSKFASATTPELKKDSALLRPNPPVTKTSEYARVPLPVEPSISYSPVCVASSAV